MTLLSTLKHANSKLCMFASSLNYPASHYTYLVHSNKLHYIDQHTIGYKRGVGVGFFLLVVLLVACNLAYKNIFISRHTE